MVDNAKGALFGNTNKKGSQPDYTGNVDLSVELLEEFIKEARKTDGIVKARLAAWVKAGNKGKFLSLSLNAPFDKGSAPARSPGKPPNDDMPF